MPTRFAPAIAAVGLLLSLTPGCSDIAAVKGSGVVKSETRDVTGFTDVRVLGTGEVILRRTGADSLTVEAEDNLLPLLESRVRNGRLSLGTRDNVNISPTRPIRYHVTVKELTHVEISGSGDIRATDIDTDRLTAEISGSGSARLAGRADEVVLKISGSGACQAADLHCKTAAVSISGSGDAVINATDRVRADVSGSGTVKYLNNPSVEQHVSGSGDVIRARSPG